MIWNIVSLFLLLFVSLVLYQITPRSIKGAFKNWNNNRHFISLINKFKKIIDNENTSEKKELRNKLSVFTPHDEYIKRRNRELFKFKETQLKHVRLLERYKHNRDLWWQLVIDWENYINLVANFISGLEAVSYGVEVESFEKEGIRMEEIENRFNKLLKINDKLLSSRSL